MHAAVIERLARLSPDQRAAAIAPPGPILCVAPAGSGKTTTLVARVCWLVDGGVPAQDIRAVTFNRRAARELELRLGAALEPLGGDSGALRVGTFHALGREILLGAGQRVEPIVDRAELLRELVGSIDGGRLGRIETALARLKIERALRPPDDRDTAPDPSRHAALIALFDRYEMALADLGGLDFDDLVVGAVRLLEREPSALSAWRARIAHLLVDEVQDLDRAQLRLALLLSAPNHRLFLVGDDDQTIYAWRLADVRRLLGLAASLPGLQRVDLVTNRRCPAAVVERAVRLISHNRERFQKRVRPRPGASGSLVLAPDGGDDAARARALLGDWPPTEGTAAVLARTRRELAPIAAAALEADRPYAAEDDGLLLDEPAVGELLDAAGKLLEAASAVGSGAHLLALGAVRRQATRERARLAAAVLGWAAAYPGLDALRAAIERIRSRRSEWRASPPQDAICLATVHATKGLEFDHVAVLGLDEGRFPNRRSVSEAAEPARALEEERRLAYVAWTRARRSLTLVYDPDAPSPFLREAFELAELTPVAGLRSSGDRR
jgi:superfamily I DNA/RNA helicase